MSGRLGWAAVAGNHLLLMCLPLAAYGFGAQLHSRLLGWVAAILTMAQLQHARFGNWMMSEALYAFLLAFGVLTLVAGLRERRAAVWLLLAGLTLGLAWLTRGVAIAVIPVAVIAILIVHRRDWKKAAKLSAVFSLPVIAAILFECSLNRTCAGQFRTSTGTAGSCMWAHRIRTFQGAAIPNTKEARLLVDLLPERGAEEAFVSNDGDQWVARYRAIHEKGYDDWEYDALCCRAARASIRSEPGAFFRFSAKLALHHLLRRDKGMALSPVPKARRRGYLPHPAVRDAEEAQANWHAYWSLPHLTLDESTRLVARVKAAASERAPIDLDDSGVWSTLRYWKSKPAIVALLRILSSLGSLWPGFALLLCAPLHLNRTTCYVLAGMYLAEAILLSIVTGTDARYQSVWLAVDTTLAAALPTIVLSGIVHRAWARLSEPSARNLSG